ncbi:MAG: metal ABC transporter substrate-binding protein [Bdellovibrionales bacterium]|nr:metal ABC transporter substrate-binding protein [Bdellovibrionales bacterium]
MKEKILFLFFLVGFQVEGKLNVLTTTKNIHSLTKSIAGDRIHLESILKGPQDPHYIAPKPSYMIKARDADLIILAGMELEIGWLPNIIQGARNPRIHQGQSGYLDASQFIQALSVPKGKVDRFFGDIHPFGNPHYLLDPLQAIKVSKGISQKLSELDPKNKDYYVKNQKQFETKIQQKVKEWKGRIQNFGVRKIVTYHSSFEYFLDRFQLNFVGMIEEKSGIPPSAKHILNLIAKMKSSQTSCILVSSFYSNKWAEKIKRTVSVHVETVAIEVKALKEVVDYVSLIEGLVQAIERCGRFTKNLKGEGKS